MRKVMQKAVSVIMALTILAGVFMVDSVASKAAGETKEEYAAVFNSEYYATVYPDLKAVYGNDADALFKHFVEYGMNEGRQGSEEFNVQAYRTRYADLNAVFGDNLKAYYVHYVKYGKAEGRNGKKEAPKPVEAPKPAAPTFTKPDWMITDDMNTFRSRYSENYYYHNNLTYAWHGGIVYCGKGEDAFAFQLSDAAFGDLHARKVYDSLDIRTGDIIKLNDEKDTAIVLKRYDDYVYIAEVDKEHVHWDVYRSMKEIEEHISYFITRYPQ